MISQWTPLPVISEKEKQLFEQLKGKLKHREEKKREKSPAPAPKAVHAPPSNARSNAHSAPPPSQSQEINDRSKSGDDKRRNDSEKEFKEVKDKVRRDAYRRRSRSHSRTPSSPRRDR